MEKSNNSTCYFYIRSSEISAVLHLVVPKVDPHAMFVASMVTAYSVEFFSVVYSHWGLNQIIAIFIKQFFVL